VKSLREYTVKTAAYLASVALLAIVILIFIQVLFRYLLHRPLDWTEELSRFIFAWTSMLGAAAAAPRIYEQGLDTLVNKFPTKLRQASDILARSITIITIIVLLRYGIQIVGRVHGQTSSVMGVRMSYVYAAIPVGLAFFLVIFTLESLITYRTKEKTYEENKDIKEIKE